MSDQVTRDIINIESEYVRKVGDFSSTDYGRQALRLADVLNDKTGALLSHVTIMIAVVGVLINIFQEQSVNDYGYSPIFISILYIELIFYMTIACALLGSIFVTSPKTFGQEASIHDRLLLISRRRRRIYKTCLWSVLVATAIFLLVLIWKAALTIRGFYG